MDHNLGYEKNDTENKEISNRHNVLNELKNRGVQDIPITSVDNLADFTEAITACYLDTEVQKRIVHQIRNSIFYVSYKDVEKVKAALNPIYTASSEASVSEELDKLESV